MSVKYPFGPAAILALSATGAQALTIDNGLTIVDGETVIATGNRTLNLTIAADLLAGAELILKAKTTGTETSIFGAGMVGVTITGAAGKIKTQSFIYDGSNFIAKAASVQID